MTEKIIVRIEVDGVELNPIDMGKGKTDSVYKEDIFYYSGEHALNKEKTLALYTCSIRMSRQKTKEEIREMQNDNSS